MIQKYILFIVFSLFYSVASSQSIPSFWLNQYGLADLYKTKSDNVKKMIVNEIGYYSSRESYSEKWTYKFIKPNICQGILSKDGELTSKFSYEFDSLKNRTKTLLESKIPLLGWEKISYEYDYEGQKIINERHYNRNSELIRNVKYTYDSRDYLTKLAINDAYETAEYDYSNGSYIYKVFNGNGKLMLKEIAYANLVKDKEVRNENGDIIELIVPSANPKDEVYHVLEYKYDEHKNWTMRKRYIKENDKKTLISKVKRKITYK